MAADGVPRKRPVRWKGASVRVRTTAGATLVVGVALLMAVVALVLFLRRSLTEDVRLAAGLRGEAVAEGIAADPFAPEVRAEGGDDEFVQVVAPDGRVIASSANLTGHPSLVGLAPGDSQRVEVPFDDDPFLAVATGVTTSRGTVTVVVGRTLDTVVESTRTVMGLAAIGLPLLLLVVALVTRRVVGRALAPVDAIRGQVDAITTAELHRRVPVPPSGDEIARLGGTMNRMLDRLQRGQERQRRFVSDASHELRSPVSSIRQHAEVALAHPSTVSSEDLARTVLEEDLRLQAVVEDLLFLARMDERGDDLRREQVDLDDLVLDEVGRIRRWDGTSIDVGRLSGGRVLGNRRRLARLVGNLLDNAVRHARTAVAVALFEEGEDVVLTVDDDGPGIPPGERGKVFQRFVRLDTARDRDSGGTGLGLAIVAEVAAVHRGAARALESPMGGARFEVRLPRAAG